jgi:hypothetical protein
MLTKKKIKMAETGGRILKKANGETKLEQRTRAVLFPRRQR